jgi:hypothetical protein
MLMMRDWARLAGFAALLAVALSGGLTWLLPNLFLSNPLERTLAECSEAARSESNKTSTQQDNPNELASVIKDGKTTPQKPTTSQANENIKYECLVATYTGKLAQFTQLLAWVTFFLIVVGIGQGVQLARSVDLARNEFLFAHRPTIRIKHVVLKNDIWQGQPIVIDVICVNNGTITAALQNIGLHYYVVPKGRPLPIQTAIDHVPGIGGQPLEVGYNYTFPNININWSLNTKDHADIDQGSSELYCVGWVSYRDGAKQLRITGFCRVLKFPPTQVARTVENCRFRRFRDPDYEYQD